MKLQKYMSICNICSRRQAEEAIRQGYVFVNGEKAHIGQIIDPNKDIITYDEKFIIPIKYEYIAYHKPIGIETINPQKGNKAITDVLNLKKDILPLGRLDKDTSGLILLTNDRTIQKYIFGDEKIKNAINNEIEKEYHVTVDIPLTPEHVKQLEKGVFIKKKIQIKSNKNTSCVTNYKKKTYLTKPARVIQTGTKSFRLILTEGKNRQIRKMCKVVGLQVLQLHRIRIGKIELGTLPVGKYRNLTDKEIKRLKSLYGYKSSNILQNKYSDDKNK